MKIQKTAKPSFHDENSFRIIRDFKKKTSYNEVSLYGDVLVAMDSDYPDAKSAGTTIVCIDPEKGIYAQDRDREFIGTIYLTQQELVSYRNRTPLESVEKLVRQTYPEGKYEITGGDPYEREFDALIDCRLWAVVKREMDFPYGVYTMAQVQGIGVVFKRHFISEKITDKKMVSNKPVVEKVKEFFTNGREGRANRMGLLLYGPPGNGKTSSIYDLISVAEELKIRVILMDSSFSLKNLTDFRETLNGERIIFVFEEMTERITRNSMEEILTFLDGENSWDNCINIATTNYPEDFPANLVDRPGRFEEFILFDNPNSDQVVQLGSKFGFNEEDSKGLAGLNLSFDYVSYMFSLAKRLGLTPKEAKEQEEAKRARLSSTFKGKMGF